MQAEQSSLSKTLKKITGLLKYKNCKYFIYLSFFLLRLPLSLVTEFCLLGFRWRAKSTKMYSSKPHGLLLCQHSRTHTHTHTRASEPTLRGTHRATVPSGLRLHPRVSFLMNGFRWFYDLPHKLVMLKNNTGSTNASVNCYLHESWHASQANELSKTRLGFCSMGGRGGLQKIIANTNFYCTHSFFPITTYKAWEKPWRWTEKWFMPGKGFQSQ